MLFMHISSLCSPFLSQALNIWKLAEKSLLGQDDSTSACLHPSHRISPLLRSNFTASFLFHISMEICHETTAWSCSLSLICIWLVFLGSPIWSDVCSTSSCSPEPAPPLVPNPQPDASPTHIHHPAFPDRHNWVSGLLMVEFGNKVHVIWFWTGN